MTEIVTTIGLDIAKTVFQIHGANVAGEAVLNKRLRRGQMLNYRDRITGNYRDSLLNTLNYSHLSAILSCVSHRCI